MLDSFRTRLTVWYTVVLGLLLVAFSVGFYSLLSRSVHARLDGGLEAAIEVTALSLNHEIVEHGGKESGEASVRDVLATMLDTSFSQKTVVVLDGRRLVAGKLGSEGLPFDAVPAVDAAPAEASFAYREWKGVRYRTVSRSVVVPSILFQYQVLASQSTTASDVELANVRRTLAACVPIGMLLMAAGGFFLARRSLEPVRAMSAAAQRISSSNLHERLDAGDARDELGQLASTFNQLLERLDQSFAQQRRFMADASHELRTPLSVALTATQVNLEGIRSDEDYRDALRIVSEQLTRLRRIVQDMFLLARADAGALRPSFGTLYLDELTDDTVRAARVMGARKGATVGWTGCREAACHGDEGLLRQLLLILLDNAVRHLGERDGRVEVTLARERDDYRIVVRDNGSGIPEAARPHVFDRFYRADKARSRQERVSGGGAGLGLAIARSIVTVHRGTIALTDTGEHGTVFTIVLPAAAPVAAPAPPASYA
jgi:heavy metal sensor kinase